MCENDDENSSKIKRKDVCLIELEEKGVIHYELLQSGQMVYSNPFSRINHLIRLSSFRCKRTELSTEMFQRQFRPLKTLRKVKESWEETFHVKFD